MGSFNASCAVSHCSINPGDPVKLIPIVSNTPIHGEYKSQMHKGFACYCHDNFSVIGYPMDATYEDYGNFEMKDDMFSQYNLSIIRSNHTKNVPEEDDDEYSSIADRRNGYSLDSSELTWEEIGEMIHFGNMYLDSNKELTKRRYMGFFPVHKCVYDLLIKRSPEMILDGSYDNVPFEKYLEHHILKNNKNQDAEVFAESMTKFMEMMGPLIGTILKNGDLMTPELAHKQATSLAEMEVEVKSVLNSDERKEFSYDNSTSVKSFLRKRREENLPELTDEEFVELVTLDAECTFFIRGLNDFQIQLIPPMTSGQVYDKTEHATFMIAAGQALLEMQQSDEAEEADEWQDESEHSYRVFSKSEIHLSLAKLREDAESDYKPERGMLKVEAIDKFITQYPNGVTLPSKDVIAQGYDVLLLDLPSTILPIVFVNDIKVE